ncbi:Uncharacterised protein [Yersinia intermedia]|uniref:hypothetical protein n=1 Tax=Yersinia intermedia TaxID=631 RepID=UPI0005E728FB|nr:hypothetical protein [Yersinia intermedia]CQJ67245.1 Uncharacterised protein [Yersinia intermedia]
MEIRINNHNSFINERRPVIDDKCDHTSKIIDSWGIAARARCRAPYTPPVKPQKVAVPVTVVTKSNKPESTKKFNGPISSALRLKASELVGVMLGKTLTYAGILATLDKAYPGHGITLRMLQMRMVSLVKSPHVKIIRHEKPVPEFTLHSVSERFYADSILRAKMKGGGAQ